MSRVESLLRQAYDDEVAPAPDVPSLMAGAHAEARRIRLRHRVVAATCAVAAIGLAVTVATNVPFGPRGDRSPDYVGPGPALPQPAGSVLVEWRFTSEDGPARVVSFLDTTGRWCRATWTAGQPRDPAHYACVPSELSPSTHGFGRVTTMYDAPMYDGLRSWMEGVASSDVARVTVTLSDHSVVEAKIVRGPAGVVFSAPVSWLSPQAYYRAFDSSGHLIEGVRVLRRLPHDSFDGNAP